MDIALENLDLERMSVSVVGFIATRPTVEFSSKKKKL